MSDTSNSEQALRSELEELFGGLESEIKSIVERYLIDLNGLFPGFGSCVDIARRAQAHVDRIAATRFSVFPYFATRELELSRIFGDLLNPSGTHGQYGHFPGLFLKELGIPATDFAASDSRGYRMHLEFPTTTGDTVRYIDIVLHKRGKFWIGIENKPWADDQPDQVRDYLREMRARARQEGAEAWMVYLSGDGKPPAEWSRLKREEQERCRVVPYRAPNDDCPSVERWIEQCAAACEAGQVRYFLRDLLTFVGKQFKSADNSDADYEEDD